ncbi:hypothetical protein M0R04_07245 [Candidatus Dojkabacteria bacterium]|jgi:hypothetical protein|nr:hypothetical protein [Candidatus Dojkabacteria bacterium]
MKPIQIIILAISIFVIIFIETLFTPAQAAATANQAISQHIDQMVIAAEAPVEGIKGVDCDITKDPIIILPTGHIIDLVTLVGCGGGNHYETFLLLASKHPNGWVIDDTIQVGSDHTLAVDFVRISDKVVVLEGHELLEEDAHCCPSGARMDLYQVLNNKLVPLK